MPTIILGSDHAGFELKEHLKGVLKSQGWRVHDLGCTSPSPCDYPEVAHAVAEEIATKRTKLGLLCCGTGIGMAIAANKHRGVRAAKASDVTEARLAREHNHANILTLGGRLVGKTRAEEILSAFLSAKPLSGRHKRRVAKLETSLRLPVRQACLRRRRGRQAGAAHRQDGRT